MRKDKDVRPLPKPEEARRRLSPRFVKIFFSYMAMVLAIAIAFYGTVERLYMRALEEQVEDSSRALLEQFGNTLDATILAMEQIAQTVSRDRVYMQTFVDASGYDAMRAAEGLRQASLQNELFLNIGLFFPDSDAPRLLTSEGIYPLPMFFNYRYQFQDWSAEAFQEQAKGPWQGSFFRAAEIAASLRIYDTTVWAYLYPIPYTAAYPGKVLLFLLDGAAIERLAPYVAGAADGVLRVFDESGTLMLTLGEDEATRTPTGETCVPAAYKTFSSIGATRLRYELSIPPDRMLTLKLSLFIAFTVCLLLVSLCISLLLTRRNVLPIQTIATRMERYVTDAKTDASPPAERDELLRIQALAEQLISENDILLRRLDGYSRELHQHFLLDLAKGQIAGPEEIVRGMEQLKIPFHGQGFAVAGLMLKPEAANLDAIRGALSSALAPWKAEGQPMPALAPLLLRGQPSVLLLVSFAQRSLAEALLPDFIQNLAALPFFRQSLLEAPSLSGIFDHLDALPEAFRQAQRNLEEVLALEEAPHQEQQASAQDLLCKEVQAFVEVNYNQEWLTLNYMADRLSLSSSYLTKIFKSHVGYTFKQYVDKIRFDKARALLRGTNASLRGILDQVGYVDETNFIRRFKALEGVTPMQYRQQAQEACAERNGI